MVAAAARLRCRSPGSSSRPWGCDVILSLMLANLQRYLRKRPGSADAGRPGARVGLDLHRGGRATPAHTPHGADGRFLMLTGLLAVVLVGVIAFLWSKV